MSPRIVDLLDGSGNDLMIMAELDPSAQMPLAPLEAARINKATLQKLGYRFRERDGSRDTGEPRGRRGSEEDL